MAGISQELTGVPATTESLLKVFRIREKTGKISLSLLNVVDRANTPAYPKAGVTLNFKVYESDDRGVADAWNVISGGSVIPVTPGGQNVVSVITTKRYIKVTGYGTGGSGYARIDAMYNGIQYFGQVDVDVVGKSGFGLDGTTPDETNGISDFTSGAWPEA